MDPIGLAVGVNLYCYANGDPINFSDPFGLCAQSKSSDTLETRYAHMSYTCVDAGEEVHAGQFLGYAGNTGTSTTGCHLHFETRGNGDVVDPMDILARHDVLTPTKRFVAAGLTSRFGKRRHPVTKQEGKMHNGIDVGVPCGTPVYAAHDGVASVRSGGGYGNRVDVRQKK